MKDGVYYPAGIRKLSEGGTFNLIQEGVDNIDIHSKQKMGMIHYILLLGSAFNKLGMVCMLQMILVDPSAKICTLSNS